MIINQFQTISNPTNRFSNKFHCIGERCQIARYLNKDASKVGRESTICQACQKDRKDLEKCEEIEKEMLGNRNTLLIMLEDPSSQRKNKELKEWLSKFFNEQVNPRLLPKLANTLIIEAKCGRRTKGVDNQFNESEIKKIRAQSCTYCDCDEKDIKQLISNQELPKYCGKCIKLVRVDNNLGAQCKACKGEELCIKMNDTGVCFRCQLCWLLVKNNTKMRRENAIAAIKRNIDEPAEAREYDRMMEDEGRITDPRVLIPGEENDDEAIQGVLQRLTGEENDNAAMREMLVNLWTEGGLAQTSAYGTQNKLHKTVMRRILNKIQGVYTGIQITDAGLVEYIKSDHGWHDSKRFFKPTIESIEWIPVEKAPKLDAKILIIPVYDSILMTWKCVIRMGNIEDEETPWLFIIFDPMQSNDSVREMRDIIARNTVLTMKGKINDIEELNSGLGQEQSMSKDDWIQIKCPKTRVQYSAAVVAVSIITIMGARNFNEIARRMIKLTNVDGVATKADEWLINVANNNTSLREEPTWLQNITQHKNKEPIRENNTTTTRKRARNTNDGTNKQRSDKVLMETNTLGKCMTQLMSGDDNQQIIDNAFYEYASANADKWVEFRHVYMLPGGNGSKWPEEENNNTNGRARVDNKKLLIPIMLKRDDMNHYVCCLRFKSDRNQKHEWDFAIIDSLNEQRSMEEIKKTIENNTTLAQGSKYLEDDIPDVQNLDATWQLTNCKRQEGAECGHRTVLHIFLALGCQNLKEYMQTLEKLENVDDLETKCREWIDTLVQNNMPGIPKWISEITR